MQDMTPPGDRSIRNIPLSGNRRPPVQPPRREYQDEPMDGPPRMPKLPKRRNWRMWYWFGGVLVICAALGFLLSTVFEGATVTVTPKTATIQTPANVVAQPNAPTGYLVYQTMTVTQNASTTVTATGTQHVSRAATGVVTIYNTYSSAPQVLVATTRLSSPDGKIYRLKDRVTVPGTTKNADGSISPGKVTVSVYADQPGPTYNQSNSISFTIVGFKGTPRYSKFVAQSNGPISGGFIGDEAAVSPDDLAKAENTLKDQLDQSLRTVASSQMPEGYVGVNGSLGVTYTDISQTQGANNTVTLSQGATATLAMVRSSDLAATLAKTIQGYQGDAVAFSSKSSFSLSLASDTASSTAGITGPLNLVVTGSPVIVWQFDQNSLKTQLLGKNKADFQTIIKGFEPAVVKASASMRPFWKATFPSDPNKVHIKITEQ